jgi:hypothetical protein
MAETMASRLTAARAALRTTGGTAAPLSAIAGFIEVAADISDADDEGAAGARELLGEAVGYLRTALLTLPSGGDDHLDALYLLAEAGVLRASGPGPASDQDDAITFLRRLGAALAAGSPERAEADAELGRMLLRRASGPGGQLDDLDEAGALLEAVRDRLAPDSPEGGAMTALLAVQRAVRYAMYGGTGADREAGLVSARTCLAVPGNPGDSDVDDLASTGHVVIAWMALTRQLTVDQRSAMVLQANVDAARSSAAAVAARLTELGQLEITVDDAATALRHLRQVPGGPGHAALRGFAPMLWAMALLATVRAAGSPLSADLAEDALRVADELGRAAAAVPPATTEHGELLALRAALLAAEAQATGTRTARSGAAGALTEAAAGLPAGHLLRAPVLDLLREALGHEVTAAASSPDVGARLAAIMDVLDRMPRDDPAFARAMTGLSIQMLSVGSTSRSVLQEDWLVTRLERLVIGSDPGDPLQPFAQYMQQLVRFTHAVLQHRPAAADALIEDLTQSVDALAADYAMRPYMLAALGTAYVERHAMGGELRHLQHAEHFAERALREADPGGPYGEGGILRGALLYLRSHVRLIQCYYDPSLESLTMAIDELERAAPVQELDQVLSLDIASELETARVMRDGLLAQGEQPMFLGAEARTALDRLLAVAERTGREDPKRGTLVAQAAAGLAMRGMADHDVKLVDQSIRMTADASQMVGLAVRERPHLLELHGQGLLTRYSMTHEPSDLSNAIDRLEEARRAVEQEIGSPRAASILQRLASAYRIRGSAARGDVDRAVTMGLAGLREHAGDVFLQDSDENAVHVARRGISDATEMSRWFIERGRAEAAVNALELGRGMVLHAATSGAGVGQVLREAGHPGLADEWDGPPEPSRPDPGRAADLRYRAMMAIEQSPAEARLLSPPSVRDIAAALTATGTDALAYLLPRDDSGRGLAILVDAAGAVRPVPLAGLYTGGASPVGAFLRARRAVEAAESEAAAGEAREAWLSALDTLCGWAWRAATGPILDAVAARGARTQRRIVLVAGGELGLVPWHAARQPDSGRYACQQAVLTYATSARQFVESARRRPRPWAHDPVLISDAEESLYLPAAGIAYLQTAYYPAAAVFGYARDKLADSVAGALAATPADVLGALPRAGHPGASLMHFGCHGRVQVPVLGSSLRLGEDDEGAEIRVEVRDILGQARSARTADLAPAAAGGLVVLAACLTDVTERDFDEALTLAAAFLSAGATGVVAARWKVAEAVTALFMTVFHQLLNDSRLSPARALRGAQLWMLDPDREVPGGWPRVLREEAAMAGRPGGPDLVSPDAWAGFTYQGQ